jgi:hypothetical protein
MKCILRFFKKKKLIKKESSLIPLTLDKQSLLVHEARRWLDFTEQGGENKGQIVEMFQKAVDGKAWGEPWCMSFVQFCLDQVDKTARALTFDSRNYAIASLDSHVLYKTEHCATCWNKTNKVARRESPSPGDVVIWKSRFGSNGHTGIVVNVFSDGSFETIEGNTSPGITGSQRDGDGVFLKKRSGGIGSLKLLGFLNPWP